MIKRTADAECDSQEAKLHRPRGAQISTRDTDGAPNLASVNGEPLARLSDLGLQRTSKDSNQDPGVGPISQDLVKRRRLRTIFNDKQLAALEDR